MNEQLECDLREALRARAEQIPTAAAVRLTGLDYRPRTRRLRPPVAIGAVASAAAAGILALVISLGAGASNAFAGWSAAPTKPAPGQLAAAAASCQRSQSPVAGLPLAVADTRGPFTLSIYADSTSTATCIKAPSFMGVSVSQESSPAGVPADRVLLTGAHRTARAGQDYAWTYGRTGADVSAVTLVLDDGTKVQATVDNGWFVAWWPSGHRLTSAELTTPSGSVTQTFNLPWPSQCNTNKDCPGGGSAQFGMDGGGGKQGVSFGSSSQ
jgi:hypothetical protein